ncbi:hypothetical protein BW730_16735 [Tessaracoccus aquimaris]|uniref:Uncharacterized protein n=1 Tax=Tessaracoccus aquimaris TaxID=1332264 RepID=A0A1Q2CS03_9ACTN|nr:hypothetical protein [Tessaracoccus aquimaris]AQP48894.1 hypothetical protein BW730_16735 [Tessaracoccus aquimaris]
MSEIDEHEPHTDTIPIPAPGVAEAHPAVADAVEHEINFDEAFYPARPRSLRPARGGTARSPAPWPRPSSP